MNACSEGGIELAKIRQLISGLGQEPPLRAVDGEVAITCDGVVVFQPRDHVGQELNLPRPITIRSEVVDPDWLALGQGGRIVDGVLEILLTIGTRSPEPVNANKANGATGLFAQVEEVRGPLHVFWVLKIAWRAESDALSGVWLHVFHPIVDGCLHVKVRSFRLSVAHEVLVAGSHTLFGVAGP